LTGPALGRRSTTKRVADPTKTMVAPPFLKGEDPAGGVPGQPRASFEANGAVIGQTPVRMVW
jgi:hypothetical protein